MESKVWRLLNLSLWVISVPIYFSHFPPLCFPPIPIHHCYLLFSSTPSSTLFLFSLRTPFPSSIHPLLAPNHWLSIIPPNLYFPWLMSSPMVIPSTYLSSPTPWLAHGFGFQDFGSYWSCWIHYLIKMSMLWLRPHPHLLVSVGLLLTFYFDGYLSDAGSYGGGHCSSVSCYFCCLG